MASTLSFIFRKAMLRDAPQLAALYAENFAQWIDPTEKPASMTDMVANPGNSFIVAEDKPGHIAGFVLTDCSYVDHGTVNVDLMAVAREFRRNGLGKALMGKSEMAARNAGAGCMTLQVAENNEPAKNLYFSLKFNKALRRPGYYCDGTAALQMVKMLSPALAANDEQPATQRPQARSLKRA